MDLRLIQEFSGDGSVNVIEWLEKAELVCALRGITRLEAVLPLTLTGGAFAVYQQLTADDKADSGKIKFALKTAFAVDAFTAYELFVARRLQPGETVDVYLAELRRLTVPFGGLPEKALVSAFVAGLPDGAKQLLRAGSRMDDLPLTHILARARAILKDESGVAAVATPAGAASGTVCGVAAVATPAGAASGTVCETRRAVSATEFRCYACNEPNHIARDCLLRQRGRGRVYDGRGGGGGRGGGRGELRCYRCDGLGHFASSCPGNDRGVTSSAPVCTPHQRTRRYP